MHERKRPPAGAKVFVEQGSAEGDDIAHDHGVRNPAIREACDTQVRQARYFVSIVGAVGPQCFCRDHVKQEACGDNTQ